MSDVSLVMPARATLGEGPCWHAPEQCLYWVDIDGQSLHQYNPATKQDRFWAMPQKIGTVAIGESGLPVVALSNGIFVFNPDEETFTEVVDREGESGTRFNDGKCDPSGRFWAGTMVMDKAGTRGNLYRRSDNNTLEVMVDDIGCSNGLTWSPDHKTFYYIDTPKMRVDAYDIDMANGAISNMRTIITVPDGVGYPDGMTIDSEGMLWVAFWEGWCVKRFNPATGEELLKVDVPVARVTACTFGGADLNELYITTASVGVTDEDRKTQRHAGGLFKIETDYTGFAATPCKGL